MPVQRVLAAVLSIRTTKDSRDYLLCNPKKPDDDPIGIVKIRRAIYEGLDAELQTQWDQLTQQVIGEWVRKIAHAQDVQLTPESPL